MMKSCNNCAFHAVLDSGDDYIKYETCAHCHFQDAVIPSLWTPDGCLLIREEKAL